MARIVGITALFAIFMLGLTVNGASEIQCSRTAHDIKITQKAEGIPEGKKPEWRVAISNPCQCSVQDLTVTCKGFNPAAHKIDPSVLAKQGDVCLVNNGDPIHMDESVNFTYEMYVYFPFEVSDGRIGCS